MKATRTLIASAMTAVVALGGLAASTAAQAAEKDKCYGIATAGKNDCASAAGTHSCAGQATMDHDLNDFKYVAKGTCQKMHGSLVAGQKPAM